MGFSGLLHALPQPSRDILFWLLEVLVLVILGITVWAGWAILAIFGSESLTSLPFLERRVVQVVLPIGAALMILARLLTVPERLADARAGRDAESREIETEIARADEEHANARDTLIRGASMSSLERRTDTDPVRRLPEEHGSGERGANDLARIDPGRTERDPSGRAAAKEGER